MVDRRSETHTKLSCSFSDMKVKKIQAKIDAYSVNMPYISQAIPPLQRPCEYIYTHTHTIGILD